MRPIPQLKASVIAISFALGLAAVAATVWFGRCPQLNESQPTPTAAQHKPTQLVASSPSVTPDSPIRSVDFKFGGPINYGDVTGDGQEEAMMDQPIETRGSAIPYRVYIYTLHHGRPKLLWRFEAGDRAEGGLRSAFADEGNLIVELYGRNSTADDPYASSSTSVEDGGACCAKYFTRTRYEWKRWKFRQKGESEILPNPSGDASPRMYRASLKR